MVRAEVRDHPADGDVAAREHLGDVEVRDERELHAAPHFGLEIAQQPGAVERVHHFGREPARRFALRRLLAQERNELARAAQRLVVATSEKSVAPAPAGSALPFVLSLSKDERRVIASGS